MRKTLLVYVLLFTLLISSCSQENEYGTGEIVRPVCTGFAFRDIDGQFLGSLGVPNNKLITSQNNEYVLTVYPIPSPHFVEMYFNKAGTKKAWITAADVANDISEEPVLHGTTAIKLGNSPLLYGSTTDSRLSFDVSNFPAGAYRLYVRYNDELFWENIIVTQQR